jgi:hypothetical protein
MAIIRNIELWWVKCDPTKPERYQGKGPAKFTVQIRVKDKKTKESLEKDFGFKFNAMEDPKGGLTYKTSISRYAFGSDANGVEDPAKPNKPVGVILANGELLDPNTVGNGSVANIAFNVKEDKSSRTLKNIQVTKLIKFEPRGDADEFDLTDDFEIIDAEPPAEKNDDPY